jgi:hypothetical protein
MGLLREQTIPTFFEGVSRQPDSIRFPGQVEEGVNVSFSVETGGFSKRPGTEARYQVFPASNDEHRLHLINRSPTEKYTMVHKGSGDTPGELKVFDITDGTEKTVTIAEPGDAGFFDKPVDDIELLTVVDFTFVLDKKMTVDMLPPPTPDNTTYAAIQLTQGRSDSVYYVTIKYNDGTADQSFTSSGSFPVGETNPDPRAIVNSIHSQFAGNATMASDGFEFAQSGSFLFVKNPSGIEFTVSTVDPFGDKGFIVTGQRVTEASDLTGRGWNGQTVEIRKQTEPEGYWLKFICDDPDADFGVGEWDETVPPGTQIDFDPATMPRALVRQTDGSFELQRLEWDSKKAGGEDLVPKPEFVGSTINDIVFRGNRLGFLSEETAHFSGDGDYFRFWPDSATQSVATDPFGLSNATNNLSTFQKGVPFRGSLFIMSAESQFEAYGEIFSPDQARLELATQYPVQTDVRPIALGDEMYFLSEVGKNIQVFSYVYNDQTVSEIANDVSRHVRRYLLGPARELAGGSQNNELFMLTEALPDSAYVHRYYYDGRERLQTSWGTYTFPGAKLHSCGYQDGGLYLLAQRADGVWIEYLPSVDRQDNNFDWIPRLDRSHLVTGVYDSDTNTTTFTTLFPMEAPVGFTTKQFPEDKQMLKLNVVPDGATPTTTWTVSGDWSGGEVVFGEKFDAYVILSRQHYREGENSVINGRLQLRYMTLRYADTGYFYVKVSPEFRDEKSYVYNGRIIGSSNNVVQKHSITDGNFRFMVGSNAQAVEIKIGSEEHLPFTITSAAWVGFFNEISRQDAN